jgi:phenylalanyl-tRNA synthetase beta chain
MIISYKFLSRLLSRPVDLSELLMAIENSGIEIESIATKLYKMNNYIIFATIEQIMNESDLSSVQKCMVNVGQKEPISILCGAKNIKEGQVVIVALPGAVISDGVTIKERKIAGHMSNGMICAMDEIGLNGQDYDGVFIVSNKSVDGIENGQRLCDLNYRYYDLLPDNDVLIDITTPSNRIDLFSYMGLAIDIVKHIDDCEYRAPATTNTSKINNHKDGVIKFDHDLEGLTSLSLCIKINGDISNYSINKSYIDLLEAAEINSHNILVDISNVIMLLAGQPSHFFDADKIDGEYIQATVLKDELIDFVAINGNQYRLEPGSLVLRDSSKVVAAAGISGALNSIVDDQTKQVIFESIIWPMENIRKTSRTMGLVTEAAKRYQRGLSSFVLEKQVLPLVLSLLSEAKLDYEIVDNTVSMSEGDWSNKEAVNLSRSWLKNFLAVEAIEDKDILKLEKSSFKVKFSNQDMINITPPEHRDDIKDRYDLAEEIIRIVGLDHIQENSLEIENKIDLTITPFYFQSFLKKALLTLGYKEVYSSSLSRSGDSKSVALLNPISSSRPYLRSDDNSMGADIIEANLDIRSLYCFDLSKVFSYDQGGISETMQMTMIASSDKAVKENLSASISSLFKLLGINNIKFVQEGPLFKILNSKDNTFLARISEHQYRSNKGKREYVQAIIDYQSLFNHYLSSLIAKDYNFNTTIGEVIKRDITLKLPVNTIWAGFKSELENEIPYIYCRYLDSFIKPDQKDYKFITFEVIFDMNHISQDELDAAIDGISAKGL